MKHARASWVVAAVVLLASPTAHADRVTWPSLHDGAGSTDSIAALRWANMPWIVASPEIPERVLASLAVSGGQSEATRIADQAVAYRALSRFDESRAALDRATAIDPHVGDDPDVALTDAYLLAHAERYAAAVSRVRSVFARVSATRDLRVELGLEIARWSMARGPDGLPDAIALLDDLMFTPQVEPMLRATLALALSRGGRVDEARDVASAGPLPSPLAGMSDTRRGALLPSEGDAAVGVALMLVGRGHEATEPLARAAVSCPVPWRAHLGEQLASARRSAR